ncbi:MAG: Glycosyl transferase, partial [Parcubacteria group bacterium GW2011_GWF2_50_9]
MNFFDNLTGYAVGYKWIMPFNSVAYKTIDGGITWSALSGTFPDVFYSIAVVSSETAYITGAATAELFKVDGINVTQFKDFSGNFSTLRKAHYSSNKLYVVGSPDASGTSANLSYSTNEGASWTRKLVGGSSDIMLIDVSFADANTGWVGGYNFLSSAMVIFKTTNGGETWTSQYSSSQTQQSFSVFALDVNNVFAAGGNGVCLISENGGAIWRETNLLSTYPSSIIAINKDVVWLSVPSSPTDASLAGIYRSVDGGRNWKQQISSYAAFCVDLEESPTRLFSASQFLRKWTPPQISSFSKNEIKQGTLETVTIHGTGFEEGSLNELPALAFSKIGISVESIDVVSSTEISATIG